MDRFFKFRVSRRWVKVGMVILVLATLLIPGIGIASHTFTDVPNSNTHHDNITWLANAGVTEGCNPPANDMFCPSDPVKRAQMATFMRRLAENQVVDAGWLQGKTAADFAASNQACAGGQAVSGFDASGNANCTSFGLTGYFSCAGTTFTPYESTVDYSSSSSLRYRTSVTGNGRFRCNVAIPNGATVTGVDFSIKDSSGTDSVSNCEMWRTNLTTSIGVETQMANAGGTTAGDTAGSRVISDTTISSATVDNDNYAYFLQCAINGTTTATGIWGADVSYSATALGTVDDPTDQPTGDSAG